MLSLRRRVIALLVLGFSATTLVGQLQEISVDLLRPLDFSFIIREIRAFGTLLGLSPFEVAAASNLHGTLSPSEVEAIELALLLHPATSENEGRLIAQAVLQKHQEKSDASLLALSLGKVSDSIDSQLLLALLDDVSDRSAVQPGVEPHLFAIARAFASLEERDPAIAWRTVAAPLLLELSRDARRHDLVVELRAVAHTLLSQDS